MKKVIESAAGMEDFARDFLSALKAKPAQATVVGLSGELGSGKTTFAQAVGRLLGAAHTMQSPTFVIMKRYPVIDDRFSTLVHIDAYRLDKEADLAKLGWSAILARPGNLILLEWPERVADVLPADRTTLAFRFIDETTREVDDGAV